MPCSSNGYEKHLALEFVLCTSKKVPVSNFLKPDSDTLQRKTNRTRLDEKAVILLYQINK